MVQTDARDAREGTIPDEKRILCNVVLKAYPKSPRVSLCYRLGYNEANDTNKD